jgi:thymidylate kinase
VVASWIGYLTAIRPTIARGELVVADRWIYGYLVQPQPLRFGGPGWLARLAIMVLPSPDLVVNLSAPVDVIHTRKSELSKNEIRRELEAWRHLPTERLVTIDTSAGVEKVIDEVHQYIAEVR